VSVTSHRAQAAQRQIQRAIAWATESLELTDQEVGAALGASARSVMRWRDAAHQPSGRHLEAAERLLVLALALDDAFKGDMARMHAWLHEPLPVFKGETPLRRILRGAVDDVVAVVAGVEGGAFA
jgi:hypothetical protein